MTALADTLAAVRADPLPSRQTDREHIEAAIVASKAEHNGWLCIAWVRPLITRDVWPNMIGGVVGGASHGMDEAGTMLSGGGSGNGSKIVRVWRPRAEVAA